MTISSAAIFAVLQQFCRLNPPQKPSISRVSPIIQSLSLIFDLQFLSISFRQTPPACTISPFPSGPSIIKTRVERVSTSIFLAWHACFSKFILFFSKIYFASDFGINSEIMLPKLFTGLIFICSKTSSGLRIGILMV